MTDEIINNLIDIKFKDKIEEIEFFIFDPSLRLAYRRKTYLRELKLNFDIMDYLLGLNDNDIYIYLWESCHIEGLEEYIDLNFIKSLATKCVYDFYEKRLKARLTNLNCCNEPVIGNKIILDVPTLLDGNIFVESIKTAGDSYNFSCDNFNDDDTSFYRSLIYQMHSPFYPAKISFVIKDKSTKEIVGFIGLNYKFTVGTPELFYYIIKPFRRKGYATEAIQLFVDGIFNKKFKYPYKTIMSDVWETKEFSYDLIRALPNEDNEISNNLLKKVGFEFVGQDKYAYYHPETKEIKSFNIYVLKK